MYLYIYIYMCVCVPRVKACTLCGCVLSWVLLLPVTLMVVSQGGDPKEGGESESNSSHIGLLFPLMGCGLEAWTCCMYCLPCQSGRLIQMSVSSSRCAGCKRKMEKILPCALAYEASSWGSLLKPCHTFSAMSHIQGHIAQPGSWKAACCKWSKCEMCLVAQILVMPCSSVPL